MDTIGSLAFTAAAMAQQRTQHSEQLETRKTIAQTELEIEQHQHIEKVEQEKRLLERQLKFAHVLLNKERKLTLRMHVQGLEQELQHHIQGLSLDTETARRENLRDVWIGRARNVDSLLIVTASLLGLFCFI